MRRARRGGSSTGRPDGMPALFVGLVASLLVAALAVELAKALDRGAGGDWQVEGLLATGFAYTSWAALGAMALCGLLGVAALVRHEPRFLVVGLAVVGLALLVGALLPYGAIEEYPLLFVCGLLAVVAPVLFWADRDGFFGLREPGERR